MKDPNSRLVRGEDIFKQPLPNELRDFELYEESEVGFIQILIETGQLVSGGPEIDLQKLRELKGNRHSDAAAEAELRRLLRYEIWYRCAETLNKVDCTD